ncbi:MAG: transcription termination/antitermination protein NusA, partial [Bacteroidia bacterium]
EIDVYRDSEMGAETEDVELEEFSYEIDSEILDALKSIGCDTAKSVLEMDREDLLKRANLTEEVVEEVISILKSEFEN